MKFRQFIHFNEKLGGSEKRQSYLQFERVIFVYKNLFPVPLATAKLKGDLWQKGKAETKCSYQPSLRQYICI
jgi:hypothetical protein